MRGYIWRHQEPDEESGQQREAAVAAAGAEEEQLRERSRSRDGDVNDCDYGHDEEEMEERAAVAVEEVTEEEAAVAGQEAQEEVCIWTHQDSDEESGPDAPASHRQILLAARCRSPRRSVPETVQQGSINALVVTAVVSMSRCVT